MEIQHAPITNVTYRCSGMSLLCGDVRCCWYRGLRVSGFEAKHQADGSNAFNTVEQAIKITLVKNVNFNAECHIGDQ